MNDLKKGGLLILSHIIQGSFTENLMLKSQLESHYLNFIEKHSLKAFAEVVISDSIQGGVRHSVASAGLGAMKPNTLVIGWHGDPKEERMSPAPKDPVESGILGRMVGRVFGNRTEFEEGEIPEQIDHLLSQQEYFKILNDLCDPGLKKFTIITRK